jgi:hypothetical protein
MADVRLQPKIAKAQIYHQPWKGGKNARTWPRYVGRAAYPTYGVPWGQMPPEQELDLLKNQTQALREQLEQIDTRMKELEASRAKSAARSER